MAVSEEEMKIKQTIILAMMDVLIAWRDFLYRMGDKADHALEKLDEKV